MGGVILFVPFLGVFGGVERLILSLSAHLVQSGYSVRVACFAADPEFERIKPQGVSVDQIRVVRNPLSEAFALQRYQRSMPAGTKWLLFDLKSAFYTGLAPTRIEYLLHLTDPPSLLPADITKASWTVARRLYPNLKRPLAQRVRGEIAHWLTKRGIAKASETIVMTRRIADEVHALYNIEPTVVPPGVEESDKQQANGYDGGPIRILSVSRLERSKRLDYVIRALAELPDHTSSFGQSNWKFDIVGTGDEETSLIELASRLNLQNRITFHGHLPDAQVDQLYKESHLFVVPAVQGYGLPALEALRRGLPVILHQDSGVSEYLSDSPWVSVISNLEDELRTAITIMFSRIVGHQFALANKPTIPSLQDWHKQITQLLCKSV